MSDKKNYLNELKKAAVALGLMASGAAALNGCTPSNSNNDTTVVTTTKENTEDKDYNEEYAQKDAIDLIIEMYNAPLNEEDKITREELGVMLIGSKTPFITEIDGKYHYDYTKYSNDTLLDGETFSVESKDISGGYVLVDNTKNQTIYGVAKIEGEIVPVDVDRIATLEGIEYYKGNYISEKYLEPNVSLYEVFRNYYNGRVNEDKQNYSPKN